MKCPRFPSKACKGVCYELLFYRHICHAENCLSTLYMNCIISLLCKSEASCSRSSYGFEDHATPFLTL